MLSETVYSSDVSDDPRSAGLSPRVAALATNFFDELQVLINAYGNEAVDRLTPMIVSVLENLDNAFSESHDYLIKLEEVDEDKQQLLAQYEREKQLRKIAEEKYLAVEDNLEEDKRELENQLESNNKQSRQLDGKCKALIQQVERLEERLSELRKENLTLKKHNLVHDFLGKTRKTGASNRPRVHSLDRASGSPSPMRSTSPPPSVKSLGSDKPNQSSLVATPQKGNSDEEYDDFSDLDQETEHDDSQIVVPDISSQNSRQLSVDEDTSSQSPRDLPQSPINDVSLADELAQHQRRRQSDISEDDEEEQEGDNDKETENEQSEANISDLANSQQTQDASANDAENDGNLSSNDPSDRDLVVSYELEINVEPIRRRARSNNRTPHKGVGRRPNLLDVPRKSMTVDIDNDSEISDSHSDNNTDSIVLSDGGIKQSISLGSVKKDSLPNSLRNQIEHLVVENRSLVEEKHDLQASKDDLSSRVKELQSEKEQLQEDMQRVSATKSKLSVRINEMKQELRRIKEESVRSGTFEIDEEFEEFGVTTMKKKIVTREEIARVISERNQYKEKVIELQEILRWTEMIRATKESAIAATPKKKSQGVWKIFSGLFTSKKATSQTVRKPEPAVIVEATQDHVLPARKSSHHHRPHKLQIPDVRLSSSDDGDSSSPPPLTPEDSLRLQKRLSDISLSCGWSRPAHMYVGKSSENIDLAKDQTDSPRNLKVPIPICCHPLTVAESRLKVWCGTVVNLSGYDQHVKASGLSSLAWICAASHAMSQVVIIDANSPSDMLDTFTVCASHVFGIVSVPSSSSDDYHADIGSQMDLTEGSSSGENEQSSLSGDSVSQSRASLNGFEFDTTKLKLRTIHTDGGNGNATPDNDEEADRKCSVMPTIWMGDQAGYIYVHSAVASWKKCLHSVKLPDSILNMVHIRGRVVIALSNGNLAIFHRNRRGGYWETGEYHLLRVSRSNHSVRCMTIVDETLWCGYQNQVLIFDPRNMQLLTGITVHPRKESQVRQMSCYRDGVWLSIRLDSKLRLYHSRTHECLQEINIEPFVTQMLGSSNRNFNIVRITSILATSDRLWVGTGSGVILIVPRSTHYNDINTPDDEKGVPIGSNTPTAENILYCSLAHAQLSFHGHRDSVKFILPLSTSILHTTNDDSTKSGAIAKAKRITEEDTKALVVTGGEGYIDFRLSAAELSKSNAKNRTPTLLIRKSASASSDRNHLLMWQI